MVAILLLAAGKFQRATLVEVQPELAELARRNAEENGLGERISVLLGDARHLDLPEVDAVVSNPPYFPAQAGHAAPNPGRDIARRERHGTLAELVQKSRGAVRPGGRWAAILPTQRGRELRELLTAAGASTLRQRQVTARKTSPPGHVLIEACFGDGTHGPELVREPELVVHEGVGREFSSEVRRILRS